MLIIDMRRARPILAIGLSLVIASAAVLCCCMRMMSAMPAMASAMAEDHSCCKKDQAPVEKPSSGQDCDRCEVAPIGGYMATMTLKIELPQRLLDLPPIAAVPMIHLPSFYVATPSLASHSPPPLSLVALHCQLTV
jgi:hypothetical protein